MFIHWLLKIHIKAEQEGIILNEMIVNFIDTWLIDFNGMSTRG